MPFAAGVFSRVHNWVTDKAGAIKITASRVDADSDDFATGLSNCICRDGQSTVTDDIPFNNQKITEVGDATADTDALNRQTGDARYSQLAADNTFVSTGAGATAGPVITLDRDSASPAASDVIGKVIFAGRDSADATTSYATIDTIVVDPTDASEDGRLRIATTIAGTLADRLHVGAGAYMEGATGTDKGAGTFNATALYQNDTAVAANYVEGTFTPTFTFVTPGDVAANVAVGSGGTYTRIGNRVFFDLYINWQPVHTTASGAAVFGGLPIASASGADPDYYSCSAGIMENVVFQGTDTGLVPIIAAGGTTFTLARIRTNTTLANAGVLHFPTGVGFTLRVSGVYPV